MGLLDIFSSKSSSSSKQEDNRIAADASFVAQIRDNKGDVTFTDQGAIALGEKTLDLAGAIAAGSLATVQQAESGAGAELGKAAVKAAVPIAIVIAIAWAFRK